MPEEASGAGSGPGERFDVEFVWEWSVRVSFVGAGAVGIELLDRLGGGGKDEAAMVVERMGFADSGLERVVGILWVDWIRDGGGRSKLLFVSFSDGRGGRIGFIASSCGDIGLRGSSGAISAGGCNPIPFNVGFVILLGTGIGTVGLIDGGEYLRRSSEGATKGELVTICGDRGGGGGGGVFGIGSGVFGRWSSCLGRIGRGDNGGFGPTGVTTTVAERGGSRGLVGVAGGRTENDSFSNVAGGLCGESTVITGCREDVDTVLRPSVRTVGGNCGDLGGPSALMFLSGGSIRGFAFGLGGGCGEGTLAGRPSTPRALA